MGAWGLFQPDQDFDMVSDLDHKAGLTKIQEDTKALAKAQAHSETDMDNIYCIIYGNCSSDRVLADAIAKKENKMLLITIGLKARMLEHWCPDPCYIYVLLGACAISLGCQIPTEYFTMLRRVYTEGGLMPDAIRQTKKALFGPNGYTNGKPYDCDPGGLFNTVAGSSRTSLITKQLRHKRHNAMVCGGCGSKPSAGDKDHLLCSRC
ncbi:hypothetical protein T440DRAFT_502031 [Plenodomus tracheiphilus IPT5]|uniref:Uncharacterized protein n=1 Tax=Plenodomus tracheiphilus IPT5 TaxID=1408161 RepID=A0A6A7ARQ4_9PLEO|nr:hypothetical protein T440DRAFT_502031 [Plenodomus tracheiphilus IPT5]